MSIKIQNHYSKIYDANTSEIGLIDSKIANEFVKFNVLLMAVIEDVSDGGLISEGADEESFVELLEMTSALIRTGQAAIIRSGHAAKNEEFMLPPDEWHISDSRSL